METLVDYVSEADVESVRQVNCRDKSKTPFKVLLKHLMVRIESEVILPDLEVSELFTLLREESESQLVDSFILFPTLNQLSLKLVFGEDVARLESVLLHVVFSFTQRFDDL